ncbi:MAG: hypothetical protein GIW94_15565 [Candidatus Eremiobacteraeota bacterium]|nr:hypothetical protein [Candidatus Eremiobacteraeota bacterium]
MDQVAVESFMEAVRCGRSIGRARRTVGITATTFEQWIRLGSDPCNVVYAAFRAAFEEAAAAGCDVAHERDSAALGASIARLLSRHCAALTLFDDV